MDRRGTERKQHEFSFFDIIVNDMKMTSPDTPQNGKLLHHTANHLSHSPGDSEACSPQESGPNGKDTKHVVICSKEKIKEATDFSSTLSKKSETCRIIACTDKDTFDQGTLPLTSFSTIYLFVDSALATIMLRKGRLHNSVYDFFDAVDESDKEVFVMNKIDGKDRMFNEILYQLPGSCTKEIKDIAVNTEQRLTRDILEQESDDEEVASNQQAVSSETGDTLTKSMNNDSDEESGFMERLDDLSLNEGAEESAGLPSVSCMIGTHCTMNIKPSTNQLVIARQDGSQNIVNINIVPSSKTSKLVIIITTNPHSPELEQLLVTRIDEKKEVLNIKLKSSDAQIVSVRKGSVIIEIEVKSGQAMGPEWIDSIVKTLLTDEGIRCVIPEGTGLRLDIESNLVEPIETLGKRVDLMSLLLNVLSDKFVERKEYEDKVKELQSFKKHYSDQGRILPKKRGKGKGEQVHTPVPVEELKQTLESAVHFGIESKSGKIDSTDIAISLLEALAYLSEEDHWEYVIKQPQLFSTGGLFYKQVERDIGLKNDKHFQLSSFTGKRFFYNAKSQSIELCVDPHGHYQIGPDLEMRMAKKNESKKARKDTKADQKCTKQGMDSIIPGKLTEIFETEVISEYSEIDVKSVDQSSYYHVILKDTQSGRGKIAEQDSGVSAMATRGRPAAMPPPGGLSASGPSDSVRPPLPARARRPPPPVPQDPDESPAPTPTKRSSSSSIPPPIPPRENRRRGSIPLPPTLQKHRNLLPPPQDMEEQSIYEAYESDEDAKMRRCEDEEQSIYEPAEAYESDEDAKMRRCEDAPPSPPLPAGRPNTSNKPPPPARKTEEKKPTTGAGPMGMGIGAIDIQGALKGLRKVSTGDNKTVEDKKNKDENNKNAKEALPFDEKKTYFAAKAKDGGLVSEEQGIYDPAEEHESDEPPPPLPSFDGDDQEISEGLDPLAKFPWYHGVVERREGERLLRSIGKDGTFLISKSTKGQDQQYTMAVLYQDSVNTLKVRLREDKRIALGEAKSNEISFKDVEGMVEHHKKHPVLLIGTQEGEITLQGSPYKS